MGFRDKTPRVEEENIDDVGGEESVGASEEAERIETLESALRDAREQTLRRTAEMENMRRRFNQEREQLIYESNKRLITDLLPSLDDIERTLLHAGSEKGAVAEGLELVHKNFLKTLERYGLRHMETIGKAFDVHLHDALMEEVRDDVEPGIVTKEIQKGYMLNETVLRHAKVIVSKEAD
jgi:molecular chaperone GrpE